MVRHRTILLSLALVVFVSTAGIAMPYPVLAPLFLGEGAGRIAQFGGIPPEVLLGWVIAVYPFGTFLGSQILGALSDNFGRRRILLGSLALSTVLYGASAYAILIEDFTLLVLSRFLTGLLEGNIAIARAAAADMTGSVDKARSFGMLSVATTGGWLVGPLLGGLVAAISYEAVFVFAAGLTFSAWLATYLFFREQIRDPAAGAAPATSLAAKLNAWVVLRHPAVRRLLLVYFLATMAMNTFYEFYPYLFVKKWGFGSGVIATRTALMTGMMVLTNLVIVPWSAKRFSARANILVALTGFTTVLFALPLPASSASLLITFPLFGIFIAMTSTHIAVYVSNHVGPTEQGKVMGLTVSLFSIGNAVIAIAGGVLAVWSVEATLLCGAAIGACGVAVFAVSRFAPWTAPVSGSG